MYITLLGLFLPIRGIQWLLSLLLNMLPLYVIGLFRWPLHIAMPLCLLVCEIGVCRLARWMSRCRSIVRGLVILRGSGGIDAAGLRVACNRSTDVGTTGRTALGAVVFSLGV